VEASDRNRFRAVEFLATLEARGGTEMAAPLLRAADLPGTGYRDRDRILVLVTDGQIGNEDQSCASWRPACAALRANVTRRIPADRTCRRST
jgi:Ca-activated chloride channel homolog